MQFQNITMREREVLKLVAHEYTTPEIASRLYLSPHTVDSHKKKLKLKLDVKNTAGMVRRGFELGLLRTVSSSAAQVYIIMIFMVMGSASLHAQEELEIRTDGIVVPRTTPASVVNPVEGQLIYDTDSDGFLYFDGSAWQSIGSGSGGGSGAFERVGTVVRQSSPNSETDDLVFGRESLPNFSDSITDKVFFFDQSTGALRAGVLDNSSAWSRSNIGNGSVAFGFNTKASRDGASALGYQTTASSNGATAIGYRTTASGSFGSTAIGYRTTASGGNGATALGNRTTASGSNGATALGLQTTASGFSGATALGTETEASGTNGATALGRETRASGDNGATALGRETTASGNSGATALGSFTTASGATGATALGSQTEASGSIGATALGDLTTASGNRGATALGSFATASGNDGATALGIETTASGNFGATALGRETTASGNSGATALGYWTTASGNNGATALGYRTIATGNESIALGRYNDTIVASGTPIGSDGPLLIVGNGTGFFSRSNALVIRQNGQVEFDNFTFPIPDGAAGQVMSTDGSGQLSWSSIDDNASNELQSISLSSNNLSLSDGGGTVSLSSYLDNTDDWSNSGSNIYFTSGDVGLGTSSPEATLQIEASSSRTDPLLTLHHDGTSFVRQAYANNLADEEKWFILAQPRLANNTANAFFRIFYTDTDGVADWETDSGINVFDIDGKGDATLAGTLTENSDIRLKKDITPLAGVLSTLSQINGYRYRWKNRTNKDDQIGLIAQEVQAQYPELVSENEEGMLSVSYTKMVPVLLEAINEQQAVIEGLKTRVQVLEEK